MLSCLARRTRLLPSDDPRERSPGSTSPGAVRTGGGVSAKAAAAAAATRKMTLARRNCGGHRCGDRCVAIAGLLNDTAEVLGSQRWLDSPWRWHRTPTATGPRAAAAPLSSSSSHHHYYQHYAAQQQLEQQRRLEWLSGFGRKCGFQWLDRAAAFTRSRAATKRKGDGAFLNTSQFASTSAITPLPGCPCSISRAPLRCVPNCRSVRCGGAGGGQQSGRGVARSRRRRHDVARAHENLPPHGPRCQKRQQDRRTQECGIRTKIAKYATAAAKKTRILVRIRLQKNAQKNVFSSSASTRLPYAALRTSPCCSAPSPCSQQRPTTARACWSSQHTTRERSQRNQSPASITFCLASRGSGFGQNRPWLGLINLSRIPSGTFFREVHPASETGCKHRQNRLFPGVCDLAPKPKSTKNVFFTKVRSQRAHFFVYRRPQSIYVDLTSKLQREQITGTPPFCVPSAISPI